MYNLYITTIVFFTVDINIYLSSFSSNALNYNYIIINAFILFALGFLIHRGDRVFGNKHIFKYLFPQKETIFEHNKLYVTAVLIMFPVYFIINNDFNFLIILEILLSLSVMITLNMLIFCVLFSILKEHHMILTLVIYFIILVVSQLITSLINIEMLSDSYALLLSLLLTFIISVYIFYFTKYSKDSL